MQWGQIKTLLILSFLVLDVYLFVQFSDKKQDMDYSTLESQESSIEEQLRADGIKVGNLPDKEYEEAFITVRQRNFEEEEFTVLQDQTPFLFSDYFLMSKLDEPLDVPSDRTGEIMDHFAESIVFAGDEYTYWGKDENLNVLIYFQDIRNIPIYYNRNGLILLYLDEDGKVEYYTQTMLGKAETLSEGKKLMKPMQVIEFLYNENALATNDEVDSVNLGYHTRIPLESGVQVFAPVWRVHVNQEKNYFINAIEGLTNTTNDEDFIMDTIQAAIERMKRPVKDEDGIVEEVLVNLTERVENLHQSEGE